MSSTNLGGRPATYTGKVKRHMIHLIRKHNISQAMDILNAAPGTSAASKRNLNLVPVPLGVCYPTLLRFAKEAGIEKRRGRPEGSKRKDGRFLVV